VVVVSHILITTEAQRTQRFTEKEVNLRYYPRIEVVDKLSGRLIESRY
jgi:hypothetical protein